MNITSKFSGGYRSGTLIENELINNTNETIRKKWFAQAKYAALAKLT